jgi:hydroxyacylglutathione hydrolase
MTIKPILAFADNYIWLLTSKITPDRCIVIDPGDAKPVLMALKQAQLTLSGILITHHHYDHTGGVDTLQKHYNVPVYGPVHSPFSGITHPLHEGQILNLPDLGFEFQILEIPGHTLDHIAYVATREKIAFCGDTLFLAGCGRAFEGSPSQLYHSLQKLAELPDETLMYCAHEYTLANLHFAAAVEPNNQAIKQRLQQCQQQRAKLQVTVPASLALEKTTNPFLRCSEPTVMAAVEQHSQQTTTQPEAIFAILREWKNHFKA